MTYLLRNMTTLSEDFSQDYGNGTHRLDDRTRRCAGRERDWQGRSDRSIDERPFQRIVRPQDQRCSAIWVPAGLPN